jgi:DNA end-binding protein Ku
MVGRCLAGLLAGKPRSMPRPTWSGSISFGLVNVPVKAYTAVHDHTVHFHQLDKDTGARVKYQKVSAKSGDVLDADDIERGFEVSKGEYVVIEDDEMEQLQPRSTRTIDITDFVELEAVDPIYYQNTYWLGAAGDESERAYRLLLAAMDDAQRVAIGTVVIRNKQYLAAIRPMNGALAMSTMRFADEIVPRDEIDGIPSGSTKPAAAELRLASQIVESLATDWEPSRYHDTYTEQMHDLIEAKAKGEELTVEAEAEPEGQVLDLLSALEASLSRSTKGSAKNASAKQGAAQKSTAKKTTAKKSTAKKSTAKKSTGRKGTAPKRTVRRSA